MLLSPEYKFVFVHVPKTAGSSLDMALRPYCISPKRTLWRSLTRRLPIVEAPHRAHFRIHDTADFIRRKLSPDVYDRLTSFAVVRDPFDHAVSHYEYMKQYRSPKIAENFSQMSFLDYLTYRTTPRRSFDRIFARLPDQSYFLCDRRGDVQVKQVLKFENLQADFNALAKTLNLPHFELPKINPARSRKADTNVASYFDDATAQLVRKIYARDFENFGYSTQLR